MNSKGHKIAVPIKIRKDMRRFINKTLSDCALSSISSAKRRAGLVRFTGDMEEGIQRKDISNNNIQIVSSTEQGLKFERGYNGKVKITPFIKSWAQERNVPKSWSGGVNFKSTAFRNGETYMFMHKSIPNKARFVGVADDVFRKNVKGGRLNG